MNQRRMMIVLGGVAGAAFMALAILYMIEPAASLPAWIPGHVGQSASAADRTHHHFKHGIAALVLAVGSWIFAWFQSGPTKQESAAK